MLEALSFAAGVARRPASALTMYSCWQQAAAAAAAAYDNIGAASAAADCTSVDTGSARDWQ